MMMMVVVMTMMMMITGAHGHDGDDQNHIHTYIHTYMHACMHACILHTYIQTESHHCPVCSPASRSYLHLNLLHCSEWSLRQSSFEGPLYQHLLSNNRTDKASV